MFSWYQIESDSAASPVSCKSYLASTDSETFAAVITFQSCKTRSRSISDRRAGLIKLYIHESISSNWTGLYFILSEHPHTVAFSVFFLMQCYFLFQTESELEWFQEGSRPALQTASIVREMWRLEDERDAEKLSFRLCKKKYQKYGWEWSEGKKKHTVEENPNCQTGVASAGRPGHNRGCSNLWENVLRSEDMSAAPIKTIITESSPSLRGREAERGSPSGGEGKVCPGCKATPAKLVDSQISTKNFIYLSWRSSRLFLMCIYWNSGPWTHTVSRTESDWGRLKLWILYYSRVIVVFWSRERWMRRRSRGGHPDCFIDYFLL